MNCDSCIILLDNAHLMAYAAQKGKENADLLVLDTRAFIYTDFSKREFNKLFLPDIIHERRLPVRADVFNVTHFFATHMV